MEDHRDDLAVIAAGYPDEMAALKEKITRIPAEFEWIALDYEGAKPAPSGESESQASQS